MNQIRKIILFLAILVGIQSVCTLAIAPASLDSKKVLQTSFDLYAKGFSNISEEEKHDLDFGKTTLATFATKELSPQEQRVVAANMILTTYPPNQTPIIDTFFVDKLNIVRNDSLSESRNSSPLVGRLSLGKNSEKQHTDLSVMGQIGLVSSLVSPTTDISLIKKRQKALKYLIAHPQVLEQLTTILERLKKAEIEILGIRQSHHYDSLTRVFIKNEYFSWLPEKLNNSPVALEIRRWLSIFKKPLMVGSVFGSLYRLASKHLPTILDNIKYENPEDKELYKKSIPISCYAGISGTGLLFAAALPIIEVPIQKFYYFIHSWLWYRLANIARYITALQDLDLLIKEIPTLQEICDTKTVTKVLTGDGHSSEFKELMGILKTNTFTGDKPTFFSFMGRAMAGFNLLSKCHHEFDEALATVGIIEAYTTIAQLYVMHAPLPAHYCFVEFVESAKQYLEAINFWNPFIDAHEVVTNSLTLDADTSHVIVSGPNTGGKSTILKSLSYSILLAQTFGIAPADKFVITPFTKILCQLNVTDDLANGISLFKAEVMHAKYVMDTLRALAPGEHAFVIMDEAIRGTRPEEAEKLSMQLAQEMTKYNALTITASHYPGMTQLQGFINKHVEVLMEPGNDQLIRTFKLKDGASSLNIAQNIFEEEGVFTAAA